MRGLFDIQQFEYEKKEFDLGAEHRKGRRFLNFLSPNATCKDYRYWKNSGGCGDLTLAAYLDTQVHLPFSIPERRCEFDDIYLA